MVGELELFQRFVVEKKFYSNYQPQLVFDDVDDVEE